MWGSGASGVGALGLDVGVWELAFFGMRLDGHGCRVQRWRVEGIWVMVYTSRTPARPF